MLKYFLSIKNEGFVIQWYRCNSSESTAECGKKRNATVEQEESCIETIFKAVARGVLLPFPVDRDIDRICHRIGIERFTFHAFRATFATRCIEQGVEVRTLQELLGHADFGLTMNLYGHVLDDTKTKAMNKIRIAL